ncbi:acyltransferase [Ralstonia solanacearum]|uniref:acyltransferase n=1 Tax=Ralstonia solanacearum TaxID=305 RepID=UPI001E583C24|nr:acyltransferase [Ralstonia solanacearum]
MMWPRWFVRAVCMAVALTCPLAAHAGAEDEMQASIGRYEDIYTGVALFASGYHLRAFCNRYPKEGAALRAAVAEFEAAYPDLVGNARQEPWFGMIEASVASSLDLTDDPDDFFHSAERCANSAATVHMLASDTQARALFLAWRFPRPAGTPAQ